MLDEERKGTENGHIERLVEHLGSLPREVIIITGLLKCQYFFFVFRRFRKITKMTICFVMSVRLSVRTETWPPTRWILYEILYLSLF